MAENHPEEPVTWLSVGVYYLSINKIAESRRFFSKASMMNPHFGAAWIGFAHTFAVEGEHEQAVSAYSTAARLFQGYRVCIYKAKTDLSLISIFTALICRLYFWECNTYNYIILP